MYNRKDEDLQQIDIDEIEDEQGCGGRIWC